MTKLRQFLVAGLLLFGLLAVPLAFAPATTNAQVEACLDGESADIAGCLDTGACVGEACPPEDASERVNSIIKLIINIFSLIVGVVAVIMIIIGGLKYITSAGDSGNITSAKNTILYAIIGLVIVALAQVIVRFVLSQAAPQ